MDPIADMLTRIRNGYLIGKKEVLIPYSKVKKEIAKILLKLGYLENVKTHPPAGGSNVKSKKFKVLVCGLRYKNKKPAITKIIRVSKPSVKIYVKSKNIKSVLGGLGMTIISTSKGIMTNKEARKNNLGGEIICKVW